MKLLLSSAIRPYGVKDQYTEATGLRMELFDNQISRFQGVHSIRASYYTYPLYLLAENISVPTVILDFPSWEDFTDELKKETYTHVGINFIPANVLKVKRMCEYIRKHYPEIKIILGGFGVAIHEIEKLVPHDEKCHGEGVSWLRGYFNEDVDAPIIHPVMKTASSQYVYGFPKVQDRAPLFTGFGCPNACEFCATSHFFAKRYNPFVKTGEEMFDICKNIEDKLGIKEFTVFDENFLKLPERAIELLAEMEKHGKAYTFMLFASAETINELGVDFMVRLGPKIIWIGVEAKYYYHQKNKQCDIKKLIQTLQANGISVIASHILFLDYHTESALKEDVDYAIEIGSDMTQFMNYWAYPGSTLEKRLIKEGRFKKIPHHLDTIGMGELNFVHPHINDPKKHYQYNCDAFKKKYREGGPILANMARTAIIGYKNLKDSYERRAKEGRLWDAQSRTYKKSDTKPTDDNLMKMRLANQKEFAEKVRLFLYPARFFSPTRKVAKKIKDTIRLYNEEFGKMGFKERIETIALCLTGLVEQIRIWRDRLLRGRETLIRQPPLNREEYIRDRISQAQPTSMKHKMTA